MAISTDRILDSQNRAIFQYSKDKSGMQDPENPDDVIGRCYRSAIIPSS